MLKRWAEDDCRGDQEADEAYFGNARRDCAYFVRQRRETTGEDNPEIPFTIPLLKSCEILVGKADTAQMSKEPLAYLAPEEHADAVAEDAPKDRGHRTGKGKAEPFFGGPKSQRCQKYIRWAGKEARFCEAQTKQRRRTVPGIGKVYDPVI